MSFLTLLTKKVAKISLSIEIVKILINNDIFFIVEKNKLKMTCFLLLCIIILDMKHKQKIEN